MAGSILQHCINMFITFYFFVSFFFFNLIFFNRVDDSYILGSDTNSYGYISSLNAIMSNNILTYCEIDNNDNESINIGDTFGTLINLHTKTIRFIKNGNEISSIYNINIEPYKLLPCITLFKNTKISVDWNNRSFISTDILDRQICSIKSAITPISLQLFSGYVEFIASSIINFLYIIETPIYSNYVISCDLYVPPDADIFQPIVLVQWLSNNNNVNIIYIQNNNHIVYQSGENNKVYIDLKNVFCISTWYNISIWFTTDSIIFYV